MNKKTEAIILGIMCFILTIAICIQINTVNNNGSTVSGSQKQNDLKSQVLKMKEKYETEYASLQRAEKELEKERESATSNNSELADLENQIKKANLILGNTDVTGEGIIVTLTDGKGDPSAIDQSNYLVHAENILQVVNEMKNAGAEAIAINGERIVSTSAISCDGNVIVVNGKKINSPIQISAIGLQELLSTLNRPGSTLEYFKNNDILTIATTHYQELKRYALVTSNVQNASVEFDIENLKPTYRLLLGIPGKSNAFAISEKLGIKKEIIDKARSLMDKQDVDIEALLKKIYDDKIEIEREKEEIQKNLNQVEVLKKNLQRDDSKLKQQEQELINNAKLKARDILLDAKDEASKLISEMKKIENTSGAVDKLNNLRNSLNSSIKEKSIKDTVENVACNPISRDLIKNGIKVYITNLNQNGIICSSKINKNDEVQVQIGLIKTNVNIKYLELPRDLKNDLTKPVVSSSPKVNKTRFANSEINVIGLTVDEAIPLVDKFLDDCFLAKIQTARIVHGKGTGKLRNAIQNFLKKHKRVKSFRVGGFGEGEMGVTVVELF